MFGNFINWSLLGFLKPQVEEAKSLREKFIQEAEIDLNRRLRGREAQYPVRSRHKGVQKRDRRTIVR